MKTKPFLSFWQIWNLTFGFLGIQFGFALQNANSSRILQTYGADVEQLSLFWLAAPLTGMIIQPIIGHYSDQTWCRLGRRRPFFLVGAIFTTIALILMPNAGLFLSPGTETAILSPVLIGAGMLMIMDASINVTMEPFRALVGDMLPDEQHTTGFSIQTFLIGIGAVVGSLLPSIMNKVFGLSNTAVAGEVADNVKFAFYAGAAILLASVLWTIFKTKEYSPEEMAEFRLSGGDEYSPLSGCDLVAKKVKRVVSMAGLFPEGKEFNVYCDTPASRVVAERWPTEIIFSGFEIGNMIFTGKKLVQMDVEDSPVKDAYSLCFAEGDPNGRMSWDLTAVLVAVKGYEPYYNVERGTFRVVNDEGANSWTPDGKGKDLRLIEKVPAVEMAVLIENYMMHQPVSK